MEKQRISLREKIYNRVGGKGSIWNTEVNAKGLAEITCATIFLGGTLLGCATSGKSGGLFGNYGSLKSSKEVTREFTNYEVKDDHNYFLAGTDKKSPDAILGLDNQYTLDSRFWHPFDPRDGKLKDLVGKMNDASDNDAYGSNVLGPKKIDIGDWYGPRTTTVKLKDGKRVIIYVPSSSRSGGGGNSSGGSSGGGGGGSGGSGK